MMGPSLTARRGCRRFSRPDGGNAEEDRGSDSDNGTPDDRWSREERDDGSALPATAVNPLDSTKHAYRRRLEGRGWWNNATMMDDDGDDSGIAMPDGGGEVADTAHRSEHSAARCCLPTSFHSHRERIAHAMHKNKVVILVGLTGSGKSTQVSQFLLEEKEEEEEEEEEDDPINGGGGDSGDPCHPPDGIWEQQRR